MPSDLSHPAVDGVLSTAATLLGMEVVFVGGMTDDEFVFERVRGDIPGVKEGRPLPRTDTLCHRLLAGAPPTTSHAAADPAYADALAREEFGITSYVGVPIRNGEGRIVGTLCGLDRESVEVDDEALAVLRQLAEIVGAHLGESTDGIMIRRTEAGWEVDGSEADDLTSAMVLADLIAGELNPGNRPHRPAAPLDEMGQLRLSVTQLEHALAARVVVEQAIGVLAERQHASARDAFERLRRVARSRGRRVHDLAREVVASANSPRVPLPPELAGPR
ncbi:MAG: GAF and ANTAR domain-containing protein [Actinomycetota bacterium]|nr:GAF and ANTAR domain-containing protein [Actinomycetota bacterium]